VTNRYSLALAGLAAILAADPTLAKPLQMTSPAAAGAAAADSSTVVRYGKYYEDHISSNCAPNFINCIVSFSKLPDTRHVRFHRIACAGTSSNSPVSLTLASNGVAGSPARLIPLAIAPTTYAQQIFSSKYIYYLNVNQEIDVIMNKGSAPFINFYANGSNPFETLTINCTLTGEIV